jgi:hypothetical protein
LETIRQFSAERLAEAGDDAPAAVAAAHSAHFLRVAEAAAPHLTGPEQGRWLAWLDADQVNLRRAADHAAHDPDGIEQVLRFGVALRRYWRARNRDEEAVALLIPVLNQPEARADPELFGTALVVAALPARYIHITKALQLAEQAVKLARQLGTGRLLIESLAALSYAHCLAGESEQGLPPGWEAVERARQLGDDVLLGVSLVAYLQCEARVDPVHAQSLLTEAIACTQRSGDHLFAYYLNITAGVHALRAEDIPAARACLYQAAQAMQAIGDENPHLSVNMGWVLRQDNDPDGARSSFETAQRISHRKGARFSLAYATLGPACLAADMGDWHRAAVLHGTAQAFLDRTGQPWQDLEMRYRRDSLGQVRAHLGQEQYERARAEGATLSFDKTLSLASEKALPT